MGVCHILELVDKVHPKSLATWCQTWWHVRKGMKEGGGEFGARELLIGSIHEGPFLVKFNRRTHIGILLLI